MLDTKREEEEYWEYEAQLGRDCRRELEYLQKAIAMLIGAGHLKQEKLNQALKFVKE